MSLTGWNKFQSATVLKTGNCFYKKSAASFDAEALFMQFVALPNTQKRNNKRFSSPFLKEFSEQIDLSHYGDF